MSIHVFSLSIFKGKNKKANLIKLFKLILQTAVNTQNKCRQFIINMIVIRLML